MRVLIQVEYNKGFLSKNLTPQEVGILVGCMDECVTVENVGYGSSCSFSSKEDERPNVIIMTETDPRLPENKQDGMITFNKELSDRNSKLYSEKWTLERDLKKAKEELLIMTEELSHFKSKVTEALSLAEED